MLRSSYSIWLAIISTKVSVVSAASNCSRTSIADVATTGTLLRSPYRVRLLASRKQGSTSKADAISTANAACRKVFGQLYS